MLQIPAHLDCCNLEERCQQAPDLYAVLQAAEQADKQAFLEQPSSQLNRQQTQPDSAFLQKGPLWAAYRRCAARARKKNAARQALSTALLVTQDGQKLEFGQQARASIDPKIIARIRYYL